MSSMPQTYTISDLIEWRERKQLVLAPTFQRGSVWSPTAKVFLIDTILNDLPMPQVFFRTHIDASNQTTVREIVDGQQRLRAILEFASGKIRLTSKAPKFRGKTYSDLTDDEKEVFLAYRVPVVQLINASDAKVLEIFSRLNSYSVKVTPAELRHAEYSEPIKWAVYDTARDWSTLWHDFGVVSVRDSVRLRNTSVVAEMFMALDKGFDDGGERRIGSYYKERKTERESFFRPLRKKIDEIIREILSNMDNDFVDTVFLDAPNFLALFAAVAFLKDWLPSSRATHGVEALSGVGVDWESAGEELSQIAQAFDSSEDDGDRATYHSFVEATRSTTHRLSSRRPRFETLVKILSAKTV